MRLARPRALSLALLLALVVGTSGGPTGTAAPATVGLGALERPATPDEAREERPSRRETRPGSRDVSAYRGLGTWIDIYDVRAWAHPEATVRAMRDRGVRTLYLQTSNFSRGRPLVYRSAVLRFLDAGARHGVRVVAWYLPGFADVGADLRRAASAIRLRTPGGNRFDSFALDIESPEVRRQSVRTRRLLSLSARIRLVAGPGYPLGAIVPSPHRVRLDPWYWPSFPYRRLAGLYDVFLPMTYFTWRVSGRQGAAWYTGQNIGILRQEIEGLDVPIHVIGGIASDASRQETRGFVDILLSRRALGGSYYTFPMVRPEQWSLLRGIG